MRRQFVTTLTRLFEKDDRLVLLLGDIGVFGFRDLFKRYPDRVYNIGICEQSMISLAAGLAKEGFIPIVHSISPFVTERCFEQLKIDLGYQELNCNIVSVGASYDYAALGCTHHCPGDVALLGTIPGFNVLTPGTAEEFDSLFTETYALPSPSYFRLSEVSNPHPHGVTFGKVLRIREGSSGMVVAVGPMLGNVLDATAELDVSVVYCTTVKPLDCNVFRDLKEGTAVAVVEPFYEGSMSSDVCSLLTHGSYRLAFFGVKHEFHRDYGQIEDHQVSDGLDIASLTSKFQGYFDGG